MRAKPNPFHIEAVATYGKVLRTCDSLSYMERAKDELNRYLVAYPRPDERYGAAIGLRGGHGSGKTHLLMWLSERAMAVEQIRPIVLYAKADQASMFDLYTQTLSELPREMLLQILDEALRGIASDDVRKAKVTESLSDRLDNKQSLEVLNKEENIDLEMLHLQLQKLLEDPEMLIPVEIARAITQLSDPVYGEKIYQWLFGKNVPGLEDVKLGYPLLQLQRETKDSSGPDVTGVNVLETIAALVRLAGRPLIVLVDQMEVLLRAEPSRQQVMFSVLKKFIEQLNRQKAITFIAGNDESWERLPSDVAPRLRLREPLRVGNLSADETRLLIEAYMANSERPSDAALQSIHSLSGGNPREIIRIAYYAYEKAEGELAAASTAVFVESANESGSVAERTRRALEIADEVLTKRGSVVKDLSAGDGILIDRVLQSQDRPRLALVAVKATDQLSEIDSARRVHGVREYVEKTLQSIPLVVVSVGYSSEEVRTLLGMTTTCIQFREIDFSSILKAKIAELLAQQASAEPGGKETGANPDVLQVLTEIALRLDKFEEERTQEVSSVAERFAANTEALRRPAEQERELRTRWDLLDALDEIQEALHIGDIDREQHLMKSLLVANEVNLKKKQLDYVGGVYLDVLSEEINLHYEAPNTASTKSRLAPFNSELLRRYRLDALRELRRILRSRRLIDRWLEAPFVNSAIIILILAVIELSLTYFWVRFFEFSRSQFYDPSRPLSEDMQAFSTVVWDSWLRMSVPLVLITLLLVGVGGFVFKWQRKMKWERIARKLRGKR